MSTCPVYLNECESLRLNDSILINEQDSIINDLSNYSNQQALQIQSLQIHLEKKNKKIVKVGSITFVLGLISGFIIGIK